MAAKFFTGLPLNGPDPECIKGFGEEALIANMHKSIPVPDKDHSRAKRIRSSHSQSTNIQSESPQRPPTWLGAIGVGEKPAPAPIGFCQEDPLAGFTVGSIA